MREAVGTTIMLQIMMIFVVVFIAFLAFTINYARVFRMKNQIVTYVEQYEGFNGASIESNTELVNIVEDFLRSVNHDVSDYEVNKIATSRGSYYEVIVYLNIKVSFLGFDIQNLGIQGETKIIYER